MNKKYYFEQRVPLNFCNFSGNKGKNWAQVVYRKSLKYDKIAATFFYLCKIILIISIQNLTLGVI